MTPEENETPTIYADLDVKEACLQISRSKQLPKSKTYDLPEKNRSVKAMPFRSTMLKSSRKHDRQSFFKYMSANTAKIVLNNQTLRWSSPLLFNDPFDVPREMSFGITPEEIVQALSRQTIELIEHPPEDTSNLQPKLRLIVETVKKGISQDLKIELLEGIKDMTSSHHPTSESMDALRAMWRSFIPDFRILCLTESPNHMAMWYHYADQYRGTVLEFRCDEKLDSAWLEAKPVTYPINKPAVYTAEGWAKLLTMPNEHAIRTIIDVSTYTKTSDWSYEREWRITSFKRPDDTGPFTDYKFHPKELSAVYLGPSVSTSERDKLTALAATYPNAVVWNVSIGMDRELQFSP